MKKLISLFIAVIIFFCSPSVSYTEEQKTPEQAAVPYVEVEEPIKKTPEQAAAPYVEVEEPIQKTPEQAAVPYVEVEEPIKKTPEQAAAPYEPVEEDIQKTPEQAAPIPNNQIIEVHMPDGRVGTYQPTSEYDRKAFESLTPKQQAGLIQAIEDRKRGVQGDAAQAAAKQQRLAEERRRAYNDAFGDVSEITEPLSQIMGQAAGSASSSGQDSYNQKPSTMPSYEGVLPYMEKDPYTKHRKGFADIQAQEAQQNPPQGSAANDCPGGLNVMGVCETEKSDEEITDYWPSAGEGK
jgi:hypothetical protein